MDWNCDPWPLPLGVVRAGPGAVAGLPRASKQPHQASNPLHHSLQSPGSFPSEHHSQASKPTNTQSTKTSSKQANKDTKSESERAWQRASNQACEPASKQASRPKDRVHFREHKFRSPCSQIVSHSWRSVPRICFSAVRLHVKARLEDL